MAVRMAQRRGKSQRVLRSRQADPPRMTRSFLASSRTALVVEEMSKQLMLGFPDPRCGSSVARILTCCCRQKEMASG
jgi:hypothetical protein